MDWSDLETFSRPPPRGTSDCAGPEASWGHRRNNLLHDEDELFFGYYLSDAIMVPDEHGPPVPEFARRLTLSSCRHDPVPAFAGVLTALPGRGIRLGDVLAGSGYSHRIPRHRASPLRQAGAQLIQDLRPHDRGYLQVRRTFAISCLEAASSYCCFSSGAIGEGIRAMAPASGHGYPPAAVCAVRDGDPWGRPGRDHRISVTTTHLSCRQPELRGPPGTAIPGITSGEERPAASAAANGAVSSRRKS